jgi:hypothetical protein
MKTKVIMLFIILSFSGRAQNINPQVVIWRITPTVVCQGDWVKVDFKYNPPSPPTYTINNNHCHVNPPLVSIWNDNSVNFPNYPVEWFTGLAPNDFCYYFWAPLPSNLSIGTHTLLTNSVPSIINVIQVTICTGIEEYQNSQNEETNYFDLYGNKIEPRKNELIIQQQGNRRKKIIIAD